MNNKNKIIIVIVIIIVGFIAYSYLKGNANSDTSALVAEKRTAEFATAKEVLSLLNRMSKITLDDGIFSDTAFQSFKDTTVVLTAQPSGRNNPFAPLGADGVRAATTTNTVKKIPNSI